jgi:hypothetical protein
LARIDFDRLLMQRFFQTLPQVLHFRTNPGRMALLFAVGRNQPEMQVSGIPFSDDEIVAAASKWGAMTFTPRGSCRRFRDHRSATLRRLPKTRDLSQDEFTKNA